MARLNGSPIPLTQSHTPGAASEAGTWSHSKRWVSQEARERNAFAKLMAGLHHIGADKSPFVPQNMSQLAALKAEIAEDQRRELEKKVARRQAELARRRDRLELGPSQAVARVGQLFGGFGLHDGLSPVFASYNCFNAQSREGHLRVDWPYLSELKDDGEGRLGRYGRSLPVPRYNMVDPRVGATAPGNVFNPDGSIRWQAKLHVPQPSWLVPASPSERE